MQSSSNQSGFALVPVIAVVAVLSIVGAGVYVYKQNNANTVQSHSVEDTSYTLEEALPADLLSIDQVRSLVAAEQVNATISTVELESADGVLIYRVRLKDGTQLAFNAQNGEKFTNIAPRTETQDTTLPPNFIAAVNFSKARDIALAQYPNGIVRKIELELEDGIVVYSVRFTDGSRVDVNASNGSVMRKKNKATKPSTARQHDNDDIEYEEDDDQLERSKRSDDRTDDQDTDEESEDESEDEEDTDKLEDEDDTDEDR